MKKFITKDYPCYELMYQVAITLVLFTVYENLYLFSPSLFNFQLKADKEFVSVKFFRTVFDWYLLIYSLA